MTSDELAPIIGAMAAGPYSALRCSEAPEHEACGIACDQPDGRRVKIIGDESRDECHHPADLCDMEALAVLANHSEAFLELVRACESLGTQASGGDAGPQQIASIRAAVRAVHAVGKEGE